MEEMKILREILEKKFYRVVEEVPKVGEVNLRLRINMKCPIFEIRAEVREKIHLLLKNLGYKVMIRHRENGICQFIIRK